MNAIEQFKNKFGAKVMAMEFLVSSVDDLHQVSGYVCDHFQDGGKALKVRITNNGNRSLSQNALYFKWLGELSVQIKQKSGQAYSSDDLHEYMKSQFCPDKSMSFGKKVITVRSTSKLDKGEMNFYMNRVHEWAVNAGFRLTMPIDSQYMELIERQNE